MPQAYNLNLEAVLSVLKRRQLSGHLTADIPRGKGVREAARVEMTIDRGDIQVCALKIGSKLVHGDDALKMIAQMGVLPWLLEAVPTNIQTQSPSLSGPHFPVQQSPLAPRNTQPGLQQFSPSWAQSQAWIPRRTEMTSMMNLSQLPRPHFQVYANVDGRRSLAEIAYLLRTTPDRLDPIVRDLVGWRLLTFE